VDPSSIATPSPQDWSDGANKTRTYWHTPGLGSSPCSDGSLCHRNCACSSLRGLAAWTAIMKQSVCCVFREQVKCIRHHLSFSQSTTSLPYSGLKTKQAESERPQEREPFNSVTICIILMNTGKPQINDCTIHYNQQAGGNPLAKLCPQT
jgi:hypothetical protein